MRTTNTTHADPRVLGTRGALLVAALIIAACGTPAERPSGGGNGFARASLGGSGASTPAMVSGRSIELVSWLVQFNRLNTPQKLEAALNKKPGELIDVDGDKDGAPDYIAVSEEPKASRGAHALALTARPSADAPADRAVHFATLFFDGDWGLLGYERLGSGPPPTPTTIAAAASAAASIAAKPPPPPPAEAEAEVFVLHIRVPASGPLEIGGVALSDDDSLAKQARDARRDHPRITAVLESEVDATHARTLAAIDSLRDAGIDAISIHEAASGAKAPAAPSVVAVPAGSDEAPGVRAGAP